MGETQCESGTSLDDAWLRPWQSLHDERRLFNSSLTNWKSREIPGRLRLWARYSSVFFTAKRKTNESNSCDAPPRVPVKRDFNHDAFNFNKARPEEVLLRISVDEKGDLIWTDPREDCCVKADVSIHEKDEDTVRHALFLNTSPQFLGHGLLVPSPRACSPQLITFDALLAGLRLLSKSTRPDVRLGYNSLGAFASVNHLHLHIAYFQELCHSGHLPVELADVNVVETSAVGDEQLQGIASSRQRVVLAVLPQWPCRTFVLYSDDVAEYEHQEEQQHQQLTLLAHQAMRLLSQLICLGHPHNMLLSPATSRSSHRQQSSPIIYIWPRQNMAQNVGPLQAWTTLAGVAYCKDEAEFESLTEEVWCKEVMDNVSLSETDFEAVKRWWTHSQDEM